MKRCGFVVLVLAIALVSESSLRADLVFGASARTAFENFRDNLGDEFIDFESLPTGTNLTNQIPGLEFRTIRDQFGNPMAPTHVEVSGGFAGSHGNTIVGSPCDPFCVDDGRFAYEIVFSDVQRRAGIERVWNTAAITRFFNESGTLLAEHQNTANVEFVGYMSDSNDSNSWVKRIEMAGTSISNTLQVGYSDDLFYGTASSIPEPGTGLLVATGMLAMGTYRRRR